MPRGYAFQPILDWPSRCATMQLVTTSPLLSRQARSWKIKIGLLMTSGINIATAHKCFLHQQISYTSSSELLLVKVFHDSRRRVKLTQLYLIELCMLHVLFSSV